VVRQRPHHELVLRVRISVPRSPVPPARVWIMDPSTRSILTRQGWTPCLPLATQHCALRVELARAADLGEDDFFGSEGSDVRLVQSIASPHSGVFDLDPRSCPC